MSGVAASIQATKSSPKKLKKSKKEKKSKKDKKKKEKKEKKAKKAKKKEESSDSDSDDDALSISDLKQKAKEIVSNGSRAKESTVGKKRRASFAEPLEDGSPRKKKKKVSASDDMPSRPRTRSFDKGQKKMSGKDDQGNPPLTDFPLHEKTIEALLGRGITHLFPIQALTFQKIYDGNDVIGRARTGCGKTLGFALPVIERLRNDQRVIDKARGRAPVCLVMCPTRELARQVAKEFESVSPWLSHTCIYGGASYEPQKSAMWRGLDIVVGTPGRIIDHIERGTLKLDQLSYFILDEADQMLDMGFEEEIQKVVDAIPRTGERTLQTLLFSATLPSWVHKTAQKYMRKPEVIDLVGDEVKKASTDVQHLCIKCPWQIKPATAGDCIRVYGGTSGRAIVFCETKKECNELASDKNLTIQGGTGVLHGDIPQAQRERTMQAFRDSKIRVLIATDVAARGLDINGVDLVIQTQPPAKNFSGRADTETYVHRSGRTGRAGRSGTCITLFTHVQEPLIQSIENAIGNKIKRIGTPQLEDLAKASGFVAMEKCEKVDKRLLPYFFPAVTELLKKFESAEDALAAALATIGGYQEFKPRSLLSSQDGFKTVMFTPGAHMSTMQSGGYVWSHLRRTFSPGLSDQIRGMTMSADNSCAVFDVRAQDVHEVEKHIKKNPNGSYSFPKELPRLKQVQRSPRGRGGAGRGRRGRGGGYGRSGSRGGRGRGGRGRGGGRGRHSR